MRNKDLEKVCHSFENSLSRLNQSQVEGILVHHTDDLFVEGGRDFFKCLLNYKHLGKVNKVGISIYSENQLLKALDKFTIDLIQLPVNVLDQRLVKSGILKELKSAGIEIHARSIFLQGLLLLEPIQLENYFTPILPLLKKYHLFLAENDLTPAQGALCFVNQIEEVDHILIGVNNTSQLRENIKNFQLVKNQELSFEPFALDNEVMINPGLWYKT